MIVAGQQPAVGGGPLYTLIKAAQAQRLAQRLGQPALFWCASEDHDLGEAGRADVLQRDGTIRRFSHGLGGGRTSLRFRLARPWFDPLLEHLHMHLGGGLGSDYVRSMRPTADEPMGVWQNRLMGSLLPELTCIEGHTLRERWGEAARTLTLQWPTTELERLRGSLLTAGASDAFGALIAPPWFRDDANGRQAVETHEALALLDRQPHLLSPGAALRPILQQVALPCTHFIAGPGEMAYHRFLAPLYAVAGVRAPQLVARRSVTIMPGWLQRELQRRGVDAQQAMQVHDAELTAESDARLARFDALQGDFSADPLLADAARRLARERVRIARTLARARQRRAGAIPAGAIHAWLQPRGRPQDRTLSVLQVAWEWGPGVARSIGDALDDAPDAGMLLLTV